MKIKLIEETGVGIIDDLIFPYECANLAEFAIWTQDNKLDFSEHRLQEDIEDPYGRNTEFINNHWYSKNSFVSRYPGYYQKIVSKLDYNANKAFEQYLKLVNSPKQKWDEEDLSFKVIHIYREGESLGRHDDVQDYGFVFYLNDQKSFSGGELHYLDPDITMAPVSGRLIIQPGHLVHEVLEVTSGIRCSMTAFLRLKD